MSTDIELIVNFYGYIRDVVAEDKIHLSIPSSSTMEDMFKLLCDKYGNRFRERVLTSQGDLQGTVAISIDNKVIDSLTTRLGDEIKENKEVNIMVIPMAAGGSQKSSVKEDTWIPTVCGLCYSHCGILVHRVDGVVVKIEGNPECPNSMGRICARGLSGIMLLYDPSRLNFPMKRTNPQKGIGIDPGWVQITWDEALQIMTDKLTKLRQEDPRKLTVCTSVICNDQGTMLRLFGAAFGSPNNFYSSGGSHCGNAEHLFGGLLHAAWSKQPDFEYCNYLLNFGVPAGTGAYYGVPGMAQRLSDARARGMKHVVIDPMHNMAAEKGDEWIPIKPGTDGALAMALLNVLLNELNIYDSDYLKHHTNAPYLITEDGYYLRDKQTKKPMVWDPIDARTKTYDDPTTKDFALTGEFTEDGLSGKTAFSLLREQVKKYSPEFASRITGIPTDTIRRIAREFGTAARIGSTIVLDGKELPCRPVAVLYFKGAQGHKNATLTSMAIELLAEIVGASNVPGGILGKNARSLGYPGGNDKLSYCPGEGPDGLLRTGTWLSTVSPYPPLEAKKPVLYSLQDLFPTCAVSSPLTPHALLEPEKFKMPYKLEVLMTVGGNFLMTKADPNMIAKAFRGLFIVSFRLYLDETAELCDLVLPDASYLERLSTHVDGFNTNTAVGEWGYRIRQPVVKPLFQRRDSQEVLLELAKKLGIEKVLFKVMKASAGLMTPYTNDISNDYKSFEEILDKRYKSLFGDEHGLEWFKEHGVLKWPKKVEEVYWKPFVKARAPIYFEFFKRVGEQIKKITEENGIEEIDTSSFQPLPDWKPCLSHQEKRSEYDLYATYFRVPIQSFSSTYNNPWLDEASKIDPYVYNFSINSETARRKGIKDGDWIELESAATGNKIKGKAKLTEGIHPEVVGMANCGGHWAKGLPLASQPGKGACFEWLMPLSLESMDMPVLNQDLCVKVKVSKA